MGNIFSRVLGLVLIVFPLMLMFAASFFVFGARLALLTWGIALTCCAMVAAGASLYYSGN